MKKILVVFSGANFASHVLEQAISVAAPDNSLLMGVFLRPPAPSEIIYPFVGDLALAGAYNTEMATQEEAAVIKANIALFKDTCTANKVNFAVHLDGGTPVSELLKESVFADLIVIDANADLYSNSPALLPTSLREFLADSHSPVLVVHEKAYPVEGAVLTYDGSLSSMHAIKMYSYLFPDLRDKPTFLVSVNDGVEGDLPQGGIVKSWLAQHFTNLHVDVLKGDTKGVLAAYINDKQHQALVVMGAYGRNAVSRMFRQSLANHIIAQTDMPLFITHE